MLDALVAFSTGDPFIAGALVAVLTCCVAGLTMMSFYTLRKLDAHERGCEERWNEQRAETRRVYDRINEVAKESAEAAQRVDEKIDKLTQRVDEKIERVDGKIDNLTQRVDDKLDKLTQIVVSHYGKVPGRERKVKK